MSEEFMCGGDEFRLGANLPIGGEDGGDCRPTIGVLASDGIVAPDKGGDKSDRVGGGDPDEVPTSGEE